MHLLLPTVLHLPSKRARYHFNHGWKCRHQGAPRLPAV